MIEVLVALGILLAGILAVAAVFPYTLQAQRDAEVLSLAGALAQMKVEEIRRDDSADGKLVQAIKDLAEPTAPIVFPNEPRLSYSFSGRPLVKAADVSTSASIAPAWVIVRYDKNYRPSQDVVYELAFN